MDKEKKTTVDAYVNEWLAKSPSFKLVVGLLAVGAGLYGTHSGLFVEQTISITLAGSLVFLAWGLKQVYEVVTPKGKETNNG